MAKVRCENDNCIYNEFCKCNADEVDINDDGECTTKEEE